MLFQAGMITGTFYGMSIMLTKLSILTFYLKFVLPGTPLRITIYITMAVVVLYSFITSFVWVYACQPLEKFWDLTITEGTCVNFLKITVFSGAMNVLTDIIILVLPLAILRDLRLPFRQKIIIMGIMATGGLYID